MKAWPHSFDHGLPTRRGAVQPIRQWETILKLVLELSGGFIEGNPSCLLPSFQKEEQFPSLIPPWLYVGAFPRPEIPELGPGPLGS